MTIKRSSPVAAATGAPHPLRRRPTPPQPRPAAGPAHLARMAVMALAAACLLTSFDAMAETDWTHDDGAPAALLATARYTSVDPGTTASLPGPHSGRAGPAVRLNAFPGLETARIQVWPHARTDCLPGDLKTVLADVAARFGPVTVTSTHRSETRNRLAGGVPHSLHLACRAIDFRVHGQSKGVMAYLRSRPEVGGLKRYPFGIIHIDDGRRRTW